MSIIFIGNAVALLGASIMVLIGLIQNKKHILIAQCFQFGIMGLGNLILGGVTGFVSNILSIVRNIYCFKRCMNVPAKAVFIAVQAGLTLYVNSAGLVGWLPAIAAGIFTWFIDLSDERQFKEMIIVCQILWIVYDLSVQNFVACTFDVLTVGSNAVGIYQLTKGGKQR